MVCYSYIEMYARYVRTDIIIIIIYIQEKMRFLWVSPQRTRHAFHVLP